jgi:hypothetical protein
MTVVALGEEGAEEGAAIGEDAAADIPSGSMDLGNGHRMVFSSEQFRQLLHSQEVADAVRARADGVTATCNATKRKKRAVYETLVQNNPSSTRARAFTRPGNADAAYDDARYSTMLKAAANAPNDPRATGGEISQINSSSGGEEGHEGAEEHEAEEGAEAAEISVVAL